MKQIGLGMMQYQQDYDERVVPYRNGARNPSASNANVGPRSKPVTFVNQLLEPYIKSNQIWVCPSNPEGWVNVDPSGAGTDPAFRSYGGQNSYGVNNYAMQSNVGPSLASFPEVATTIAMVDTKYYNVLPKSPCKLKGDSFDPTTSFYVNYWKHLGNSYGFRVPTAPTDQEAEGLIKSRHLETLNTLFMDGHVKALKWDKVAYDSNLAVGNTTSIWDPYKQGCN